MPRSHVLFALYGYLGNFDSNGVLVLLTIILIAYRRSLLSWSHILYSHAVAFPARSFSFVWSCLTARRFPCFSHLAPRSMTRGSARSDAVVWCLPVASPSQEILHHDTLSVPIRSGPLSITLILRLPTMLLVLRRRVEDIEESLPSIRDLENAGHVPAPVAVVGCRPYGAQAVVVQDLVALLAELVGA